MTPFLADWWLPLALLVTLVVMAGYLIVTRFAARRAWRRRRRQAAANEVEARDPTSRDHRSPEGAGAHREVELEPTPVRLTVDDRGVTLNEGEDAPRSLSWTAVDSVTLHTVADALSRGAADPPPPSGAGPPPGAVVWELEGDGSTLAVPSGADGIPELFAAAAHHLPGFDHEAVIAAIGSTREARFLVWRRPA